MLNAGPHRFALRLTEPLRLPAAGAALEARAEVDLPEGEELDRVEFYLNETRLATLYQPPFAVALVAPPIAGLTYLRAVAFLAGGGLLQRADLRAAAGGLDHRLHPVRAGPGAPIHRAERGRGASRTSTLCRSTPAS